MATVDPFSSATEMIAALDNRKVSSAELVEMHIERIERLNSKINAIVVPTFERAREAAEQADALREKAGRGSMLGLPITLKESTHTPDFPCSAGFEVFRDYRPAQNSRIAATLYAEGVALLGKTNIPMALGDWQADSPVYGRTGNPWDTSRTPGGSTGGGGAALAAGLTPFEIGSDIGGSIRVPAAYCGVYGHRPSESAVPKSGGFPNAELPNPGAIMGVQGPLARSAADLELGMDVIAGPDIGEETAWHLRLPAPRYEELKDFRVAVIPASPIVSPSADMKGKVDELASFLGKKGATVKEASPDFNIEEYFFDYARLLSVQTFLGQPREERDRIAAMHRESGEPIRVAQAEGLTMDAADYIRLLGRRERARKAWREFFHDWDVLIGPMTLDAAFPHQEAPFQQRVLQVDGEEVPYFLNIFYPMWAIFAGLPSTAFPAGLNSAGLPLGLQAIGPYLEDRTTMAFARLLEREWHAFEAPPGF